MEKMEGQKVRRADSGLQVEPGKATPGLWAPAFSPAHQVGLSLTRFWEGTRSKV